MPFLEPGKPPRWPFHTEADRRLIYEQAFADVVYQNLMLENYRYLRNVVLESERLLSAFDRIIARLEAEIESK